MKSKYFIHLINMNNKKLLKTIKFFTGALNYEQISIY